MSSFFQKLAGGLRFEEKEPQVITASVSKPQSKTRPPQKLKVIGGDKNEGVEPGKPKNQELTPEPEGQLALDVYQNDYDIIIKSTIAGVKPDDLDIEINNDMITIRGKREKEEEVRGENYFYQECYWGAFSRSVILPREIDADQAEASLKNGVLSIRLPKFEKTKSKKLKVKSGE